MTHLTPEIEACIQKTADEVATQTVKNTLTTLGIDHDNPIEVQKDMAHIRANRVGMEAYGRRIKLTAIAVVTTAVLGAVWVGFQALLGIGGRDG
jgi:hypothetical protein